MGMTKEQLINMWDMYRENHSGEESGGVSGVGSKPSTLIISQEKEVVIFTKSQNEGYLKCIVPWEEIISQKVYQGKVKITEMNSEEIKEI